MQKIKNSVKNSIEKAMAKSTSFLLKLVKFILQ